MTAISKVELGLFASAGLLMVPGGLIWTGLYGVPQNEPIGFTMFVLGAMCGSIFWGLTDKEL